MGAGAFIAKILTGGLGDTVAKIIEEFNLSPEQRAQLQEAIIQQQTQLIQAVNPRCTLKPRVNTSLSTLGDLSLPTL